MYDCFKLIYTYLNEGDKVSEFYSCLKMVIQVHLHVVFFTIFFIKCTSLKRFYLYLKLLQSSTIKKKKESRSVLRLKCLHEIFYNSQFKKCKCNSTHSYNSKVQVDIPSYIIFPCFYPVRRILFSVETFI